MVVKFDIMNLVVQSDRHFASIYHLSKCHLPHIQYSHKQYACPVNYYSELTTKDYNYVMAKAVFIL
jgi:hypothetical protein